MAGKAADTRLQSLAAVQSPGKRAIFAPRHVAKLAPAQRDADGLCVVRIVRLADELERIADPQFVPQVSSRVIAKPRERRALHDYPDARLEFLPPARRRHQQSREQNYSPNALRIHSTRDVWAPTRNTSKRSEEHTSELQSPDHLVCRLLLEKKKNVIQHSLSPHTPQLSRH